jgi:hypothetical protein
MTKNLIIVSVFILGLLVYFLVPRPVWIRDTVVAQIGGDCRQNEQVMKLSFPIAINSATTSLLMTPPSNQGLHVCGIHFTQPQGLVSAVGVQFMSSASAACTSPTNLTGAMTVGVTAPGGYSEFNTPANGSLCIKTTGTSVDAEGWGSYCTQ